MTDCLSRIQANMQERHITLISNIPNAMQPLYLDKTMLSVALNNLLSNAVKYNSDHGSITVELKESDESVDITIAWNRLLAKARPSPCLLINLLR